MIHYIANEGELQKAVEIHQPGDLFKFTELFHVEGRYYVERVTLHDMNVILKQRHYNKIEGIKPFLDTKLCDFVRCRVNGVIPSTPTTWQQDGLQYGVIADDCNLYDCSVDEVNYIGFMLTGNTEVFSGSFNNCATPKEDYGVGHPLWVQGVGYVTVVNATFNNNRHCIASHHSESTIFVTNCEFSCGKFSKKILDRHSENAKGGRSFYVNSCVFNNPNNYAYEFPVHYGEIEFTNCTFSRPFGKNGRIGGVVESEGVANYKNNLYA